MKTKTNLDNVEAGNPSEKQLQDLALDMLRDFPQGFTFKDLRNKVAESGWKKGYIRNAAMRAILYLRKADMIVKIGKTYHDKQTAPQQSEEDISALNQFTLQAVVMVEIRSQGNYLEYPVSEEGKTINLVLDADVRDYLIAYNGAAAEVVIYFASGNPVTLSEITKISVR